MNTPYVFKKCSDCNRWLVATTDNFYRGKRGKYGLRGQCKKCKNAYHKEYQKTDKYKEYHKEYQKTDKYKEYSKEYQKEYHKEYDKEYRQTEQGQVVAFNSQSRRRTRLANNGGEITKEQWLECMNFFNWCCAYSGRKLTKDTRSLDHIESIARGGSNNIWNVVPMLRSLNSSKQDKDMEKWYKDQDFYSKERLAKIYEWIEYSKNKYMEVTLNA